MKEILDVQYNEWKRFTKSLITQFLQKKNELNKVLNLFLKSNIFVILKLKQNTFKYYFYTKATEI